MKTAFGLVATTIITAAVATGASAEWRLYVNRDNKAWSLERAYVTNDECDRAARTLYRSGQALGVGCAEYPAPGSAQAQTPRSAEFSRSTSSIERQVARSYETPRTSASRAPRVKEYPARSAPRATPVAEAPAAVIFPPSGGMAIQQDEPPRPAVVARAAPQPRRQAAPKVAAPTPAAPPSADDDKGSAAVMLARAATEASAASDREAAAETAKREAAVVADQAERRTTLVVFSGVMLVIMTGVAYSVYRVARRSPLRGLAVCLMEIGALTAALAYPVAEMWARLKISDSFVLSSMPGLLAGVVIAGVGVIVLALDLTRNPSRSKAPGAPRGAERKPQAPVELIKPGEYIKAGEPSKPVAPAKAVEPVEPARPVQPIRTLEPVSFLEAPKAPEGPPKWAAVKATQAPAAVDAVKPLGPAKAVEPATPLEPPKWAAVKSAEAPSPGEPAKPVEAARSAEPVQPLELTSKPLELVTSIEGAKQVDPAKPDAAVKPADPPTPVVGDS